MSKQYRHQRALAKEGKRAQFGSYTYTATDLNEKGMSRPPFSRIVLGLLAQHLILSIFQQVELMDPRSLAQDPRFLTASIR